MIWSRRSASIGSAEPHLLAEAERRAGQGCGDGLTDRGGCDLALAQERTGGTLLVVTQRSHQMLAPEELVTELGGHIDRRCDGQAGGKGETLEQLFGQPGPLGRWRGLRRIGLRRCPPPT